MSAGANLRPDVAKRTEQARGGEVDGDAPRRDFEPAVAKRAAHSLPRLLHRAPSQGE
jgi:hypothetical protein